MALEFTLKLIDMMSAKMNAPISEVKQLSNVSTAYAKQQQETAKTVVKSLNDMKLSLNDYRSKLASVKSLMESTRNSSLFGKWKQEAKDLQKQIGTMEGGKSGSGWLGSIAKPLLAATSIGSIGAFGMSSVRAANQFGAQKKSYEVLTGNAGIGGQLADDLRTLKESTIMGPAVYKNAQTMLAYGISASKVTKDLRMLGDVSMGDANRLQHLTLAFSEVQAQGRLTGKEVRQFVNAGFNPLKEISRTTGKSMSVVQQEMHKGAISASMVEQAFQTATNSGGRFNGMLEKMAETSSGKMQLLEGRAASFKIAFGESLQPISNGIVDTITRMVTYAKKMVEIPVDQKLTEQINKIRTLQAQITSTNISHTEQLRLYHELKEINPNLVKGISEQNIEYEKLAKNVDNVTGAIKNKIGMETLSKMNVYTLSHFEEAHEKSIKSFGDAMTVVSSYPNIANRIDLTSGQKQIMVKAEIEKRLAADPKHGISFKGTQTIGGIVQQEVRSEDRLNLDRFNYAISESYKAHDIQESLLPAVQKFNKAKGFVEQSINNFLGLKGMVNGNKGGESTSNLDDLKGGAESAMAGQKTITINISRVGVDKFELHTTNLKEGVNEIEQIVKEAFLRVVNSANGLSVN